jgi:hypothetical protein
MLPQLGQPDKRGTPNTMLTLAIRFVLELIGVGAVVAWGLSFEASPWRVALAIVAPLALIVIWRLVVAPRADNPLSQRTRQLLGSAILLLAAGAVAATGNPVAAGLFATAVIANQLLLLILHPRLPVAPAVLAGPRA